MAIGKLLEYKEHLFNNIYKRSKLQENHDQAGLALTKLKGYLKYDTRWEYDGDGEPYLIDNVNEPPLYTIQWTAKESGSHLGVYSVEVAEDDDWDSTVVYNFSDVRSTYQKIEDIMRPFSIFNEGKVFPFANSIRISSEQDDYEPTFINKVKYYPFSIEDDGKKYYFDEHGNSVKHIWNAICFGTKEEALDFGNEHLIFGELDVEEVTKTEQVLDSFNEGIDDFPKSNRAMWRFAKRKHDDTKATRKYSGAPYFVHPESVAQIIQAYGGDRALVNCGLAHDLIEDAGVTIEDLAEKFGKKVALIVDELTNDNREISKLGKEAYMSRKLENLSDEALFCKLADQMYNLLDYPNETQAKRILKNLLFIKDRPKKGHIKDIYDDTLNTAFYVCSKF